MCAQSVITPEDFQALNWKPATVLEMQVRSNIMKRTLTVVAAIVLATRATQRARSGGRRTMMNRVRVLFCDDSGQDLVEYALLAAFISLSTVGAVQTTGRQVTDIFSTLTTALTQETSSGAAHETSAP